MIREVEFKNFRNLSDKYLFGEKLNVITGKNNTGKTNFLDGIRLAFSTLNNDYFRIKKSDFADSNDENPIIIKIKMDPDSIPSLNYYVNDKDKECGFMVTICKNSKGKYIRKLYLFDGSNVDYEIVRDDEKIPEIYMIPFIRAEDIYTDWLPTSLSKFITDDKKYKSLLEESMINIKSSMEEKLEKFKQFCRKFDEPLDIEMTEPKITDEKVYVVSGTKEHDFCIGSGYKSIANIILNSIDDKNSIVLIDEIENHLHPSLIRTLLREINSLNDKAQIIATTHSPVVINELLNDELIDISKNKLSNLTKENKEKIERFLHPGRSELFFGDNIVLVEGITEEMLLKYYLKKNNHNWTIINVAGIMFEPYIELGIMLDKKIIVISDNDIALSSDYKTPSDRFIKLQKYCNNKGVKLLETYNTLESDLFKNGILTNTDLLSKIGDSMIYVAKNGKKTLIAQELIETNIDLSGWHIIKEIENEFNSN